MEDPSLGACLVFINILNYSTVVAFIISHSRPVDLTPFMMMFKDPAAAFKKKILFHFPGSWFTLKRNPLEVTFCRRKQILSVYLVCVSLMQMTLRSPRDGMLGLKSCSYKEKKILISFCLVFVLNVFLYLINLNHRSFTFLLPCIIFIVSGYFFRFFLT